MLQPTQIVPASDAPPETTAVATHVRVLVGPSKAPYSCPLYLLQRGSATLRGLLADQLESDDPSAAVPLPSVEPRAFESVAVYWERFYGVDDGGRAARVPRPPLRLPDLYLLSAWEHRYCVERLLGAAGTPAEALCADGRWVDAVAGRGAAGQPPPFALAERQAMWASAAAVCDAATVLRSPDVQALAAAVLANMLFDGTEESVRVLLGDVPEFTTAARQDLLAAQPWLAAALADDADGASAAVPATNTASRDQ